MQGGAQWSDGAFHFSLQPGAGPDLVISFSSVGADPDRVPAPEFLRSAAQKGRLTVLSVADAGRSFGTDPAMVPALMGALGRCRTGGRIFCTGLSMGACFALAALPHLGAEAALLFGPQWAIGPDHPAENRWAEWSRRLPPLAGARGFWPPPAACRVSLFHALGDDRAQALAFPHPAPPGVDQLIFPARGHSDLVAHLKSQSLLPGLFAAAFAGDRRRLIRLAGQGGGMTRRRYEGAQQAGLPAPE